MCNATLNNHSLLKIDFVCSLPRAFACGRNSIERLESLFVSMELTYLPKICLQWYSLSPKFGSLLLQVSLLNPSKADLSIHRIYGKPIYMNPFPVLVTVIFPNTTVSLDKPTRIQSLYLQGGLKFSIHSLVRL